MEHNTFELLISRAQRVDKYAVPCADGEIWNSFDELRAIANQPEATEWDTIRFRKKFEEVKKCVSNAILRGAKHLQHQHNSGFVDLLKLAVLAQNARNDKELSNVVQESVQLFVSYRIGA